ncbi:MULTISPECIES: GAF domain-containing sensor histidine kinase [Calothrix]|uniref:histidine kinase n=2 Tax=Calothrix TaxID=1186 RepID=A0ABR8AKZ4_9CYAN|nr:MULTISPECIES: GAF domain-containing sensor histidine kinase [Calothrix]MBD2199297.1 GAF domain-containing sensor histidine kinase [Calothrix parietina FACHB-288]MBD2227999.1 GAF domain-containing sensor histidine kinase [Calothrix anomala FACHB-343]
MPSSSDLSFSQTLPSETFNQLGELLQQMAQAVESGALLVTEAVLARVRVPADWQEQRFTLLVSEQFSALLVGYYVQTDKANNSSTSVSTMGENPTEDLPNSEKSQQMASTWNFRSSYSQQDAAELTTSLTFNSQAIATFLAKLRELFAADSHTYQNLTRYSQIPPINNSTLQSQFSLLLLESLMPQINQVVEVATTLDYSSLLICQPVEDALKKQISQERLLNQVTNQIRRSLDLSVIMATAVTQVREFLELDRLVIYKFDDSRNTVQHPFDRAALNEANQDTRFVTQRADPLYSVNGQYPLPNSVNPQPPETDYPQHGGCIVYEVRATDTIPSVLNYREEMCFLRNSRCWEKYRQGFTLAVDDVEKTYALEECLLHFLREVKVRAKLAAPIMFEEKLWGLLIAHQCYSPREWTDSETKLLTSIAEQLAIAIHQSELMRSLTQEKHTLEQRVVERTVALRDALLAAEAASRLRNEFLATISHELLTPLTYVIGMSSTLLRWPIGELSQRQRDYLQTIHDSGEHLLEMINDILDLSQIEAGKTVLNITEFSLKDIAENTLKGLEDKATTEQLHLTLDLQIDPRRDRFTADATRIEQIICNLLTNAIKFTPKGGNVTLRLWVEEDTAIFQVEDTGIGIPEEQLPLLFEKFQQLDTPYRRRYEGTGLGLALTKQLVELHRGRIEVESTVGIGSIFTVWIPAQPIQVLKS